jgi:hypothetical protein
MRFWTPRTVCGALGYLLLVAALLLAPLAWADPATDRERARDDEIAELKRKLDTVVNELETLRSQSAAPEAEELEAKNGFGPAAAKIYGVAKGVSLGGYAEGAYRRRGFGDARGQDEADLTRAVLYLGYKFNDWIVWNSELEWEHATTEKNGSINVEFATLDFLLRPDFNLRVGEILLPMGLTNQVHEPPFYYGTNRPMVETVIIPATWSDIGAGFFGTLGERIHYEAYLLNGLDATLYQSSGIREGRQGGSEALARDLAYVGNVNIDVIEGLRVGGSYYSGGAGQAQHLDIGGERFKLPTSRTSIWELHGSYRWRGLTTRGLFASGRVADAGRLSQLFTLAGHESPVISRRMLGGYGEIAYDVLPLLLPSSEMSLEPFFRYEYVDTQNDVPAGFEADRAFKQRIWNPGIQFKPIPNVVLKLDYRNIDDFANQGEDEVGLGFGLVF